MLKPITAHVKEKLFLIGELRLSEEDLRSSLGEPHYIETDGLRTCGGPQWFWGFVDDGGSIVAVDYHPMYKHTKVGTSRPDVIEKLLAELGITGDALARYDRLYDYHG